MTERELDLIEFAAREVAERGTGAPQILRS
jgi:hypothetical protein